MRPYLLMLLKLQLDGRFDTVAGVVVGLFKSEIHQVFVIGPSHISTDKDDDVGQDLHRHKNNGYVKYLVIY